MNDHFQNFYFSSSNLGLKSHVVSLHKFFFLDQFEMKMVN